MRRICAAAVVLLLAATGASAQDRQRGPVFRGGIEVIEVDVSVVDSNGRPIADMLGPEFTVTIDGQPRRVVSAQFISLRPQAGARAANTEKPEVLVSSNAATPRGRLLLIVVDRESISFGEGRHVVRAAAKFLETLGPDDKVGFVSIPMPGPLVDFTSNHELVRKALDGMAGLGHRPERRFNIGVYEAFALSNHSDSLVEQAVMVRLCGRLRAGTFEYVACELEVRGQATSIVTEIRHRVQKSVEALEAILEGLREVEGPKSVVWISEGLVIEGAGQELSSIDRLSAAANATVNVIMIDEPLGEISERQESPTLKQDRELEIRGLELMAAVTRGTIHRVSTNPDAVFRRMEEELSGYYLLAVEAEPTDRNGRRHPIKVSVRRRGANVRARREFHVVTEAIAENESTDARLARTLRSPFAVTELPVRVATYAYHDPKSSKVRVFVAAEIQHPEKQPADVTLGYVLTDRDGKVAMTGTQRVLLRPVEGPAGPLLEHAGNFIVDPGSYTLKFAAVDAEGRRGSLEHPVQAWKMAGLPFAVGDLMLADSPPRPGDPIRPPVEARLATGRLVAYMEIYANQPELFGDLQVRIEVAAGESDAALVSGRGELAALSTSDSRAVLTVVPLDALPPGQYIARAIVTRDAEKIGQLARPFHITAAAAASRVTAPAANAGVAPSPSFSAPIIRSMLAPAAPFQRADVLKTDVVGFFLDVLDKGRPALKATTAGVRRGKMEGAGLQALEAGDQLAAAFLRGLELFSKGDLNQAATQFAAALRVSPDFAPASFYLGACYAAAGRDQEAATSWRRALIGADKTPVEYVALGDALFRMGDAPQAIALLSEALTRWPEDDQIRRRLATAYAVVLQHKEALTTVEPYVTENPSDHEALLIAAHAIYASTVVGQPLMAGPENRGRMKKYASAYAAANGPHAAVVNTWADFVAKQ